MSKFNLTYHPQDFTNLQDETDELSASRGHEIGTTSRDDSDALPPPRSVAYVRSVMSGTRLADHLAEFDREALEEGRIMCSIPATSVDDTARAQLLAGGVEKEDLEMQHRNELDHIDLLKRNRILELEEKRQKRRTDQSLSLRNIDQMRQQTSELVDTYYDHASNELEIHLTSRQGEVSQSIGEIRKFRRGDYDPDKPDWKLYEQQVQVRVVEVRGLKNKVPEGDYIVLVSKWDKLGGDPLRWSNREIDERNGPPCLLHGELRDLRVKRRCEICKGWAGGTSARHHSGDPRAYDLAFGDRMFTFFQPQARIKPYNCLLFELVRLPPENRVRKMHETDDVVRPHVVGWGVIPIVDSHFAVINGKFRFPMLRGPYKPQYGHYKTIQEALNSDLENWLGNMYVEVVPWPREHYGRNEFTLQREFSNKLLDLTRYPSSTHEDGWIFDGKPRGVSFDETNNPSKAGKGIDTAVAVGLGVSGTNFGFDDFFPYKKPTFVPEQDTPALQRWMTIKFAITEHRRMKRREEQEAMKEAIKREERSKQFRYSIHPYGATNLSSEWRLQVEYCMRAIKDELNLRDPMSLKFYLVCFVFFVSLYFQLYIHGCFIWLALRAVNPPTPIDAVEPHWYGLHVKYSHRQTTPLIELFVVFFSQMSLYFLLLAEIIVGYVFRFTAGTIPEQLSKFVFTTALSATMVPFLEMIIDGIMKSTDPTFQERSDYFRLQNFFYEHDYGQYFTIIVFVTIYLFMFAGCVVSTFLFTMGVHLNGILQDSFWRIVVVNEETCHMPDDLEISIPELRHICRKAEEWRGKNGERRKISVYKLITTHKEEDDDEDADRRIIKKGDKGMLDALFGSDDGDYMRIDLHILICQLNCGSVERWKVREEYEVYREFMVEESGGIFEAVGDRKPHGVSFVLNDLARKLKVSKFGAGDGNAADALLALFGAPQVSDDINISQSMSPTKGKKVGFFGA